MAKNPEGSDGRISETDIDALINMMGKINVDAKTDTPNEHPDDHFDTITNIDVDGNTWYDVGLICSVRTGDDADYIKRYVAALEAEGLRVFWPPRDTNQHDPGGGLRILVDNTYDGFARSREIHIIWNKNSRGSLFDLGACFMMGKPLRVVNPVNRTPEKSFQNAILDWQLGKLGVADPPIHMVEFNEEIEDR